MNTTAAATALNDRKAKGQSNLSLVMGRMLKSRNAIIGMVILGAFLLVAVLAPAIAPYDFTEMDLSNKLQGPSFSHPFGTDELGRDLLSRMIYGSRYTLSLACLTVAFSLAVGIFLGMVAGYFGGIVDLLIMRFLDVFSAIPGTLMAIIISAVLGAGYIPTIIALEISGIDSFVRMLRASTISVSQSEFVEAAVATNCRNIRIMVKHVFPNAVSPLIVQATMGMARAILSASSLSFIGLGIQPPNPEWGAILASSRNYIRDYPYLVMIPGVLIMLTVLAFNLIGDALRDALDPKLKK